LCLSVVHHFLDILLKSVGVLDLSIKLNLLILLQLFDDLLVMKTQLIQSLFELS
jgi:hypothetical protein